MAAKKSAKKKTTTRKKGGKKAVQAKLFHKIGEVCDLTDTEPFVLRYWEQEFPFLAPEKTKSGHRIYTDEDIDTVREIKRLLYDEKYTTAGARRWLEKQREERKKQGAPLASPLGEQATPDSAATQVNAEQQAELERLRSALKTVKETLAELRQGLAEAREDAAPAKSAGRSKSASKGAAAPKKKKKASKARGGR